MLTILSPGTWHKLPWFCLPPGKTKLPMSHCWLFGGSMGLTWAFGDLCWAVWSGDWARYSHTPGYWHVPWHWGSFSWLFHSTHISGSSYAHLDILQGLIVFPVLFLSLSASIRPVLVTMATGEIQSQYLLTASVIQPSTRIAVSCFCVCLMFPSLKSDAFGQGHCTRSGSEQPVRQFQARLLHVFMYVCACVCPCLLWNTVQISSACVRKGGRQVGGEKFHKSSYREVLLWREIFQSFSWNLCSLHFPRFLPAQLIMQICFALGDDGSALIWVFMWEIEKICQKMCALRGWKMGQIEEAKCS